MCAGYGVDRELAILANGSSILVIEIHGSRGLAENEHAGGGRRFIA